MFDNAAGALAVGFTAVSHVKDAASLIPFACHSHHRVQTGGTLYECGVALKAAGASSVQAFVAHGVFPKEAWKRFAKVIQSLAIEEKGL